MQRTFTNSLQGLYGAVDAPEMSIHAYETVAHIPRQFTAALVITPGNVVACKGIVLEWQETTTMPQASDSDTHAHAPGRSLATQMQHGCVVGCLHVSSVRGSCEVGEGALHTLAPAAQTAQVHHSQKEVSIRVPLVCRLRAPQAIAQT